MSEETSLLDMKRNSIKDTPKSDPTSDNIVELMEKEWPEMTKEFKDIQLHIEWKTPTIITGDGQNRGNSGIFFQKRYELQILDSYENSTYANGQAASIYKQYSPRTKGGVNSSGGEPFRKNAASIGMTYDEARDAFIPKQPYPDWTLNEDTCRWEAPVAYPEDGQKYIWNETTQQWDLNE